MTSEMFVKSEKFTSNDTFRFLALKRHIDIDVEGKNKRIFTSHIQSDQKVHSCDFTKI